MTGWIADDDVNRLVREIDVALNGVDASPQAKLCDIAAQVGKAAREFGPILKVLGAPPKPADTHSDDWAIAAAFREVTGPGGGLIKNDEVVDFISTRARELIANSKPAKHSASITAEWVKGYLSSDTAPENLQAIEDAFGEWAALHPATPPDAELIERFRIAARALIGIRQPPAPEGQQRPVYAEDVETMADVLRVLEGLDQQTEATPAAVAGTSAESINALADWVQQRADACWHEKHTLQLEDVAKRIRALSAPTPAPDIKNNGGS